MKKYTTPEVEVIEFQIQEAIASDVSVGPSADLGVGDMPEDGFN